MLQIQCALGIVKLVIYLPSKYCLNQLQTTGIRRLIEYCYFNQIYVPSKP